MNPSHQFLIHLTGPSPNSCLQFRENSVVECLPKALQKSRQIISSLTHGWNHITVGDHQAGQEESALSGAMTEVYLFCLHQQVEHGSSVWQSEGPAVPWVASLTTQLVGQGRRLHTLPWPLLEHCEQFWRPQYWRTSQEWVKLMGKDSSI